MKVVSFDDGSGVEVGVLTADGVVGTGLSTLSELLATESPSARLEASLDGPLRPGARLLAPQSAASKMLFCGVNYRSHLVENPAATLPAEPYWFSKLSSAVVGPGAYIVPPSPTTFVDYEVELAIVVGRRASKIDRASAMNYVFGYTLVNDVSARDLQFDRNQLTLGKNPDTFCPMGPVIVTADAMGPLDLEVLTTRVNGEERQRAFAADMLFSISELLEHLTALITLEPGDIVTTGTPAGVGCFMQPPGYLKPGDEVTVSSTSIGDLTNTIAESAP